MIVRLYLTRLFLRVELEFRLGFGTSAAPPSPAPSCASTKRFRNGKQAPRSCSRL